MEWSYTPGAGLHTSVLLLLKAGASSSHLQMFVSWLLVRDGSSSFFDPPGCQIHLCLVLLVVFLNHVSLNVASAQT